MADLGKAIAQGRTAEVYVWQEGLILKLFRDGWPVGAVENEAQIARAVQSSGLPVPAVGEIVEMNGRFGLIYERASGPSLLANFLARPWTVLSSARLLARLHTDLHDHAVPALPALPVMLEKKIDSSQELPPDLKKAVLKVLHEMPGGEQLCHGDFHPDNVLLTSRGAVVIDWSHAARGNPLADIARTSLMLTLSSPPPGTPRRQSLEVMRGWFHRAYLKHYFRLRPADQSQLSSWLLVVAAARVREDISGEQERLLAILKKGLRQVD